MVDIKDGGQAFPRPSPCIPSGVLEGGFMNTDLYGLGPEDGMTLRDYFAAKAMQSLIALNEYKPEVIASASYDIADEMLSARDIIHADFEVKE